MQAGRGAGECGSDNVSSEHPFSSSFSLSSVNLGSTKALQAWNSMANRFFTSSNVSLSLMLNGREEAALPTGSFHNMDSSRAFNWRMHGRYLPARHRPQGQTTCRPIFS